MLCLKDKINYLFRNTCINFRHIEIATGPSQHFVFSIRFYGGVDRGTVGFSAPQRKWATLSIGQVTDVLLL